MSMAAPVLPLPLQEGDRLTLDEFLRRWEAMPDLYRAELIDGVVSMPSPITKTHSRYQWLLNGWLNHYETLVPGCAGLASGTWLMSTNSAPQPDLAFILEPEAGGQSGQTGNYSSGAPELVIEVSHTTSAKDKGAKLRLYERSGVREYVTVRPAVQEIVWRELVDGCYRQIPLDSDGLLRSRVFPGLWLDPAALWAQDAASLAAAVQRGIATR